MRVLPVLAVQGRYTFPAQDTKLQVGDTAFDVGDRKPAGTVFELDPEQGFIVLKRQGDARTPRGLPRSRS